MKGGLYATLRKRDGVRLDKERLTSILEYLYEHLGDWLVLEGECLNKEVIWTTLASLVPKTVVFVVVEADVQLVAQRFKQKYGKRLDDGVVSVDYSDPKTVEHRQEMLRGYVKHKAKELKVPLVTGSQSRVRAAINELRGDVK